MDLDSSGSQDPAPAAPSPSLVADSDGEKLVSGSAAGKPIPSDVSGAPFTGPALAIDLNSVADVTINLETLLPSKSGTEKEKSEGIRKSRTFLLSWVPSKTEFLVHPSCAEAGLRFYLKTEPKAGAGRSPYFAAWCNSKSKSVVDLEFSYLGKEPPTSFGSIHLTSARIRESSFEAMLPVSSVKTDSLLLGSVKTEGSESLIYFAPPEPSRLQTSVALQASLLRYLEPTHPIQLSEIGLLGKVSASYRVSSRWDISANGFVTLLPILLSSTNDQDAARFWGLNGRIGYLLPSPSAFSMGIAIGYYLMGLQTSGNYGIPLALGPQVFLTASALPGSARIWFLYLKYALLTDSPNPNFSNHEIAVGGGYLIAKCWHLPLLGVLDISEASFSTSDGLHSLFWMTGSLGAQLRF